VLVFSFFLSRPIELIRMVGSIVCSATSSSDSGLVRLEVARSRLASWLLLNKNYSKMAGISLGRAQGSRYGPYHRYVISWGCLLVRRSMSSLECLSLYLSHTVILISGIQNSSRPHLVDGRGRGDEAVVESSFWCERWALEKRGFHVPSCCPTAKHLSPVNHPGYNVFSLYS